MGSFSGGLRRQQAAPSQAPTCTTGKGGSGRCQDIQVPPDIYTDSYPDSYTDIYTDIYRYLYRYLHKCIRYLPVCYLQDCPLLLVNLNVLRGSICFKSLFVPGVCCPDDP